MRDTDETLWHPGMGQRGRRREPWEQWLVDPWGEPSNVLWLMSERDQLSWEESCDKG